MAVVKGIKERVHLPLYDALAVRPGQQLREVESSSVLKFFVNVQGKTKLETNMQSSSLLPHWNTFEARALRVVLSDLAPRFPAEVERCLCETGAAEGDCRELLESFVWKLEHVLSRLKGPPQKARDLARKLEAAHARIHDAGEGDLEPLEAFLSAAALKEALLLLVELAKVKKVLLAVLAKTKVQGADALKRFGRTLADAGELAEAGTLSKRLDEAASSLETARQLFTLVKTLKGLDPAPIGEWLDQAPWNGLRDGLEEMKGDLRQAVSQLGDYGSRAWASPSALRRCLEDKLGEGAVASLQLAGDPAEIFATLVYNSVTSFFVGEKVMIQMPTWFFPAGGGPYSDDGRQVTHGFPSPEATFRFAEPIHIDTQQNFRVEIEVPERGVLAEIQRLYGPLFIWVVVDGYMVRDVQ